MDHIKRFLFKFTCFMTAVLMVAMALLVNLDTFSWFNASAESSVMIRADTTEDIISKFEIDNENPEDIVIQRANGLDYEPVVYFSVSGDAADYILHINSYRLEDNDEHRLELRINVNLMQYLDLLFHRNKVVKGTIILKHLNEYIIESRDIEFTGDYLRSVFWNQIDGAGDNKTHGKLDDKDKDSLVALILNLTDLINWDRVFNIDGIKEPHVKGLAVTDDMTAAIPDMNRIMNPIPKLSLSDSQREIIEAVAPGIREYIDKLYGYTEDLVNKLNEKMEIISILNMDIENLNNANTLLELEKAELTEDNGLLKQNLAELEEKNKILNDRIDSLEEDISDLKARNKSLSSENSSLREEVDELKKELKWSRDHMPVEEPPVEEPPVEEPPVEEPPVEEPPVEEPPVEEPPVEEPPIEEPTVVEEPVEEHPVEEPHEFRTQEEITEGASENIRDSDIPSIEISTDNQTDANNIESEGVSAEENGQAEDSNQLTSGQSDDQTNEDNEQEVIQENNTGPPIT